MHGVMKAIARRQLDAALNYKSQDAEAKCDVLISLQDKYHKLTGKYVDIAILNEMVRVYWKGPWRNEFRAEVPVRKPPKAKKPKGRKQKRRGSAPKTSGTKKPKKARAPKTAASPKPNKPNSPQQKTQSATNSPKPSQQAASAKKSSQKEPAADQTSVEEISSESGEKEENEKQEVVIANPLDKYAGTRMEAFDNMKSFKLKENTMVVVRYLNDKKEVAYSPAAVLSVTGYRCEVAFFEFDQDVNPNPADDGHVHYQINYDETQELKASEIVPVKLCDHMASSIAKKGTVVEFSISARIMSFYRDVIRWDIDDLAKKHPKLKVARFPGGWSRFWL